MTGETPRDEESEYAVRIRNAEHAIRIQGALKRIDPTRLGDDVRMLPMSHILTEIIKERHQVFDAANHITIKQEGALVEIVVQDITLVPVPQGAVTAGDPLLLHLWVDGFTGQVLSGWLLMSEKRGAVRDSGSGIQLDSWIGFQL